MNLHRIKPNLAYTVIALDVNVRRLNSVTGVKKEAIWPIPQNRRHNSILLPAPNHNPPYNPGASPSAALTSAGRIIILPASRPRSGGAAEGPRTLLSTSLLCNSKEGGALKIQMTVNGQPREAEVEPRLLLVHFLRDNLGLTGTKIGCDTSQCGSCVVRMNGATVKSCTCLAAQADGAEITTIEGLAADGELHAMQEAFWDNHGLQCGYCTAGMIMTAVELLERNPDPSPEEVRQGLEGNICRCTGYHNIVRAVLAAAAAKGG